MLLAVDKFKGCLSAADVSAALRTGLLRVSRSMEVVLRPVADGGDGTLEAALAAGFEAREVAAAGPLGDSETARIGIRDGTALIELAEICGLARLPSAELQPMRASTYGLGLAMKAAIDLGYRDLVIGVGGSASTDGGMGVAAALGARILDHEGNLVRPGGAHLGEVSHVDLEPMMARLVGVTIVIASDVDSPLTGQRGAAAVFAPQKGASTEQVRLLAAGLEHWAAVLHDATGVDVRSLPAGGAAGGVAVPLLALDCARVVSGAELILDLTGTLRAIDAADVVVTGEGRWDDQTSAGKAPHAVLEAAGRAAKPVIAVAGSFAPDVDLSATSACYSLADLAGPDGDPFRDARVLLQDVGERIAARL